MVVNTLICILFLNQAFMWYYIKTMERETFALHEVTAEAIELIGKAIEVLYGRRKDRRTEETAQ